MKRATRFGGLVVTGIATLGVASAAQADIFNGDFSSAGGLYDGWNALGLHLLSRDPIPASYQPVAPAGMPATPDNTAIGGSGGGATTLEVATFLGDASQASAIDALHTNPSYGAVIAQTFSAAAGQSLSFDWNLISADFDFEDFAFVYLAGPGIATPVHHLADSLPASVDDNFDILFSQTGLATYNSGPLAGGPYTLGLGVFNSSAGAGSNNFGQSYLFVDNVELSEIPEPASAAVLMAGALGALAGPLKRARPRAD
jgi:hypothetical protein